MGITKRCSNFYDTPVDQQWYLRFDVLTLPRDHRKILNRQPIARRIILSNGLIVVAFLINWNVMSN